MKANAKDMRYRLRSVLGAVDRGESVYVTYRGKVRAKMIPAGPEEVSDSSTNPFYGMWRDREEMTDVDAYVREVRKGRFADDH